MVIRLIRRFVEKEKTIEIHQKKKKKQYTKRVFYIIHVCLLCSVRKYLHEKGNE